MIHYHGGPITPDPVAAAVWKARHAFVSFAHKGQLQLAMDVTQSFAIDNGAFSFWKSKKVTDWSKYYAFVGTIKNHPRFDWAIIPDVIDGTEADNDKLLSDWPHGKVVGVPVYHLHESIARVHHLATTYPRIALGSSGEYSTPGSTAWKERMIKVMDAIVDTNGYPVAKVHGLRMLNPKVYCEYPFSSADSTNIARNIGIDKKWKGTYTPATKTARGLVMVDRIENTVSKDSWTVTSKYVPPNRCCGLGLCFPCTNCGG